MKQSLPVASPRIFPFVLELIVFISGALVMVYEVTGSRILAPYVGTSIIVWTSIIGIILGSLSIGYYLGGRLADARPHVGGLAFLLFVAALLIAVTAIFKEIILQSVGRAGFDIKTTALVASTLLFAPASIILGMVSPFAVKLKLSALNTSGATVGMLYALSTVGSIVGTFLAGFYFVPTFGVSTILFLLSLTLLLLSFILAPKQLLLAKAVFATIFVGGSIFGDTLTSQAAFYDNAIDISTTYNRVLVRESERDGRPIREMMIGNEHSSAMFLDGNDLVYEYTRFYHLARHFFPDFKSGLVLGGAGYSFPKSFLQTYPDAKLDVVEIDPGLTEIAREYFNLPDDPDLTIHHEDARTFLNTTDKKFDVIFGDAFNSQYSIPFHLTTKEAVQKNYDILTDKGVVILNVISAVEGDRGKFLRAEYATYKSIFPHVLVFPVRDNQYGDRVQNIILVASKNPQLPPSTSSDSEINRYLAQYWSQEIPLDMPILTDDYAPVDYYISQILKDL